MSRTVRKRYRDEELAEPLRPTRNSKPASRTVQRGSPVGNPSDIGKHACRYDRAQRATPCSGVTTTCQRETSERRSVST